ncbi:MAG: hypothetical protein M1814_006797 [Vezdaea aestivalis]|nr:MAG: hypothetical protein M1814_006797 [Vezdaea aestivalis]
MDQSLDQIIAEKDTTDLTQSALLVVAGTAAVTLGPATASERLSYLVLSPKYPLSTPLSLFPPSKRDRRAKTAAIVEISFFSLQKANLDLPLSYVQSTREESRNIDRDWVHDKFDDQDSRRPEKGSGFRYGRRSPGPDNDRAISGTKIRVDNLHWDLTEDDVQDLFTRIGPVTSTQIIYDRSGRSTGRAFAIYALAADAAEAVRQFDGANANGQPIQLTLIPQGPATVRRRNPFDDLIPSRNQRSLADRVTFPRGGGRTGRDSSRSISPDRPRQSDVSGPAPEGIDRYVPGQRTRSPRLRRPDSGRRPGGRGDRNGRRGDGPAPRGGRNGRTRKTEEELDQEMADYFGEPNNADTVTAAVDQDVDMIE